MPDEDGCEAKRQFGTRTTPPCEPSEEEWPIRHLPSGPIDVTSLGQTVAVEMTPQDKVHPFPGQFVNVREKDGKYFLDFFDIDRKLCTLEMVKESDPYLVAANKRELQNELNKLSQATNKEEIKRLEMRLAWLRLYVQLPEIYADYCSGKPLAGYFSQRDSQPNRRQHKRAFSHESLTTDPAVLAARAGAKRYIRQFKPKRKSEVRKNRRIAVQIVDEFYPRLKKRGRRLRIDSMRGRIFAEAKRRLKH